MGQFFIVQTNWEGRKTTLTNMPFLTLDAAIARASSMIFASDIVKITPTSKVYYSLGRVTAPQQIDIEIKSLMARA